MEATRHGFLTFMIKLNLHGLVGGPPVGGAGVAEINIDLLLC